MLYPVSVLQHFESTLVNVVSHWLHGSAMLLYGWPVQSFHSDMPHSELFIYHCMAAWSWCTVVV